MQKFEEKLKDYHSLRTRCILWYVRDCLLLEEAKKTVEKKLRSIDEWRSQMSDEDVIVAQMLLSSGVDVETIIQYQELCKKHKKGFINYL